MSSTINQKTANSVVNYQALTSSTACYTELTTPSSAIGIQTATTMPIIDHDLDSSLQSGTPSNPEHVPSMLPSVMSTSTSTSHPHIDVYINERQPADRILAFSTDPTQYVSWGVNWRKPAFMSSMLFCGFVLSIGHHLYYRSLNNTTAGNPAQQAWSIRFGTAFAFLVVACLHASTAVAFGQYVWTVVRRRSLTIGG
jgi:hypothetical protein